MHKFLKIFDVGTSRDTENVCAVIQCAPHSCWHIRCYWGRFLCNTRVDWDTFSYSLARRVDFAGFHTNVLRMFFPTSFLTDGRSLLFPLHKQTFSSNPFIHIMMLWRGRGSLKKIVPEVSLNTEHRRNLCVF